MASCTRCTVCDNPGTVHDSPERGEVPSNVRRFQHERFTVWRCRNCGSLHCQEDVDLPRYYEDYPLQRQRMSPQLQIGFGNLLRMLQQHGVDLSQRLLDYGCGTGMFVSFLRAHGATQVTGYDPFVPAFAGTAALADTYDAVVSWDVIEHFDDPRGFLASAARLVRPGGVLAIGTPNADYVSVRRTKNICLHQPYHRHILSERALVGMARAQGLTPIHISRRSYFDCLTPTVNWRFMRGYIETAGGLLDVAFERPRRKMILRSPKLLASAFLGGVIPAREYLVTVFRRS